VTILNSDDPLASYCQHLLIVLGSTLTAKGDLSPIAKSRLDKCLEICKASDDILVLLTGGFGGHFNKTGRIYALYAYEYLVSSGLDPLKISALVASTDTVEDATMSFRIIEHLNPKQIKVITSDFHLERVRYIFERVFINRQIDYFSVPYHADAETLFELKSIEQRELILLSETGVSSLGSKLPSK
jgi:vancomycin permeability regulator SanA